MAFKGTASKSSSGASMSKYDVEVAAALKQINARLDALEAHSHEAPCDTTTATTDDHTRIEQIVATLKAKEPGKWRELH